MRIAAVDSSIFNERMLLLRRPVRVHQTKPEELAFIVK
jgi:hypothetical protein